MLKRKQIVALILLYTSIIVLTGIGAYYPKPAPEPKKIVTLDRVRQMYHALQIKSGSINIPPLVISKSNVVNAWTDGSNVFITTKFLEIMNNNENMIALVLGHEIAHVMLDHVYMPDGIMDPRDKEAQADKLGAFIALRAGFDVCDGSKFYLLMESRDGDFAASSSHPSYAYRYSQIQLPGCSR